MPSNNSFSSGFGAGTNLGAVRVGQERNQLARQGQEFAQQQAIKQEFFTKMKENLKLIEGVNKASTPGIYTEEELGKPEKDQQNRQAYFSAIKTTWQDSMLPTIEMAMDTGLIGPEEAGMIREQFLIATKLTDPRPAQDLAASGEGATAQAKAEGQLPSQLALERQRAITRGTPTSQNISTTDMTPDEMRMADSVSARAALKDLDRVNRQLRKAQNAFDSWKAAPGSGGITGSVAENIGGLIGQIPLMGEGMENGLNLMLTGGTTAENTRARTNAITLASDMLSEITGEESGRFTEAERNLAFRALRQLSPSASIPQIASAYRTFIETSVNAKSRASSKMGVPTRFETEGDGKLTTEGRTDYVVHLMKRGFTEKQAIDAVKRRIRDEELEGAN